MHRDPFSVRTHYTERTATVQSTFDALGVPLAVHSDCSELGPALARFLPAFPSSDLRPAVTYRLLRDGRGAYALLKGRRTLRTTRDFALAVAVLVQDVQTTLAARARGLTLVHAGVVGIDGSALLLPGAPGAGKSTLVAELLRAGAAYASDEFAVLDEHGRVWPYPRWLALRDESGVRRLPAEALTTHLVAGALPVRTIVFTEFHPGSRFEPRPLSQSECVLRTLAHCPGARVRPVATLHALRAAAAGAAAVQSRRGEAGETAGILLAAATRVQSAAGTR